VILRKRGREGGGEREYMYYVITYLIFYYLKTKNKTSHERFIFEIYNSFIVFNVTTLLFKRHATHLIVYIKVQ